VVDYEGQSVVTAPSIEIEGIDFTGRPGVSGAGVNSVQLLENSGDPSKIYESFESPSLDVFEGGAIVQEKTNESTSSKKPYGDVVYADPGYQKDKKKRYPLDTKKHVLAAWSYINQGDNAKEYSSSQLSRMKSRIKKAAKKMGINIEESFKELFSDLVAVFESNSDVLVEDFVSVSAGTAQADINVQGWGVSPEEVPAAIATLAMATINALLTIDPDLDDDIDTDGGDDENPNDDESGECANCLSDVPDNAMFCPICGQPVNQAAESAPKKNQENQMSEGVNTNQVVEGSQVIEVAAESRDSLTLESIEAMLKKMIAENISALVPAPVAENANGTSVEGATTKEGEVTESTDKNGMEAEVSEKSMSRDEMLALINEAREQGRREAQDEILESVRASGELPRKGLAPEGGSISESIAALDGDEAARATSRMSVAEFRKLQADAYSASPFWSRKFNQADQMVRGF
jgi:hypothetical protein